MRNIPSLLQEYKKETHRIHNKSILIVNVKEKLSELVSRRIRELGLKNAEVARRTGLSRSYIGNMANGTAPTQSGEYEPSPEVIEKLSTALEISQNEILEAMNYLTNEATDKIPKTVIEAFAREGELDPRDHDLIVNFIDMLKKQKKD